MTWKDFMAIILLLEIMVMMVMLLWAIPTIIDEIIKSRKRNKFGREISRLFEKNCLERKQIEILSKEYLLNSKDVQKSIRRQYKETLEENEPLSEKINYFQDLYLDYERDEPFEGLPSDVRLHLERIREIIGKEHEHMLQPLASQLQELNDETIRKNKNMKLVSVLSLFIGIASLIFGTYTYYEAKTDKGEIEHNKKIEKDKNVID